MNPSSFKYRALAFAFENLPARCCGARWGSRASRCSGSRSGSPTSPARPSRRTSPGDRRAHLQPRTHVQPARGTHQRRRHVAARILHESTFPGMDSDTRCTCCCRVTTRSAVGVRMACRCAARSNGSRCGSRRTMPVAVQLTYAMAKELGARASSSKARRRSPTCCA